MCYWSCGLESCSVPFRVNTKTSVTALICWLHPLPIKAGKIQKSEILCSQAAVMPAANEPLVFTWCKERAVYKRNDQCLYCWDAAVFSWLPKLDGIQLPALLLWGAVLAVSALLCYGSLWKSSGFVEWERGCALQKLHCEANVSVHVQRFGGSEASTSCQFYFLADFCPHPGINIRIHTSLGRGSRGCT